MGGFLNKIKISETSCPKLLFDGPLRGEGRTNSMNSVAQGKGRPRPAFPSLLSSGKSVSNGFSKAGQLCRLPCHPPPSCPHAPAPPCPRPPRSLLAEKALLTRRKRPTVLPAEEPGLGSWVPPTSCQLAVPSRSPHSLTRQRRDMGGGLGTRL